MSNLRLPLIAFGLAASAAAATTASAAPVVITDKVDVAATNGASGGNYNYYWGSNFANYTTPNGMHWGDTIGSGFNTTQMTIDRDDATKTLSITMRTEFNGSEVFCGSPCIDTRYADLFIDTSGDDTPDNFNLAVALGYQDLDSNEANGVGALAEDVYTISGAGDYSTSRDIWGSRPRFIYGGYNNFRNDQPGYNNANFMDSPTRLTNGANPLANLAVNTYAPVSVGGGFYDFKIDIVAVTGTLSMFDHFDIFWGTGDCSNDAIWGTIVTNSAPAPAAMLLLGLGLAGMGAIRRRAA